MVAAVVFGDRLSTSRTRLRLPAALLLANHFLELFVGLRVVERPLLILALLLLVAFDFLEYVRAGVVVRGADLKSRGSAEYPRNNRGVAATRVQTRAAPPSRRRRDSPNKRTRRTMGR